MIQAKYSISTDWLHAIQVRPVIRRQNKVQKLRFRKLTLNPAIVYSVVLQTFIGLYVPRVLPVEEVTAAAAQKPAT